MELSDAHNGVEKHSRFTQATMDKMSAPDLSYFGFEKFDSASEARSKFQIFYEKDNPQSWSDSGLRGTFDTLQLFDKDGVSLVKVPRAKGDAEGMPLEPFTNAYPQYGIGGAQQLLPIRRPLPVNFIEVKRLGK